MKRAVIGAVLMLGAAGSACDSGTGPVVEPVVGRTVGPTVDPVMRPILDPIGTIENLTLTPDRGPSGTVATVTWEGGRFTYSVRVKQGRCGSLSTDGTAMESSCPALVGVADDLPASGSTTVVLTKTNHLCVFPVRHAGMFAQGRCTQAAVIP
jgi:hypothetical protein